MTTETEEEYKLGTISLAGKDIAIAGVEYDRIAVSAAGNSLMFLSVLADSVRIKAMRSILNGGAKARVEASGGMVIQPSRPNPWSYPRHPGNMNLDNEGYNTYIHKMDYGLAHAMFVCRQPSFMLVYSDETLWGKLKETRYTTPIVKDWLPYIRDELTNDNLLVEAESYRCRCGVLNATTDDLDRIVTAGIRDGKLLI
jgi:hypothetical protein